MLSRDGASAPNNLVDDQLLPVQQLLNHPIVISGAEGGEEIHTLQGYGLIVRPSRVVARRVVTARRTDPQHCVGARLDDIDVAVQVADPGIVVFSL